jgi:RNA polymerase sigma-70 factor (ECF subfamily)
VVPRALSEEQQQLVARYVAAFEAYDVVTLTKLLHNEATLSMPPYEMWLQGHASITAWLLSFGLGLSRLDPRAGGGERRDTGVRAVPAHGRVAVGAHPARRRGGQIMGMTSYLDVETLFPAVRAADAVGGLISR